MGALNDIACTLPSTGDELLALADVATTLRRARANRLPIPIACAGGHSSGRFVTWGAGMVCAACGCRPLPADQLHALLTRALRVRVLDRAIARNAA